MIKIAFGGRAGSGKSTAAKYLSDKYSGHVLAFADPLYELLAHTQQYLGFPIQKDREYLQTIGMWARKHDQDVWVNKLAEKSEILSLKKPCFISDLRFINEMRYLKDHNYITVLILRDTTDLLNHPSETELSDPVLWDHVIENNGTLDELYRQLDELITSLMV